MLLARTEFFNVVNKNWVFDAANENWGFDIASENWAFMVLLVKIGFLIQWELGFYGVASEN